jgi:hypothetical protein
LAEDTSAGVRRLDAGRNVEQLQLRPDQGNTGGYSICSVFGLARRDTAGRPARSLLPPQPTPIRLGPADTGALEPRRGRSAVHEKVWSRRSAAALPPGHEFAAVRIRAKLVNGLLLVSVAVESRCGWNGVERLTGEIDPSTGTRRSKVPRSCTAGWTALPIDGWYPWWIPIDRVQIQCRGGLYVGYVDRDDPAAGRPRYDETLDPGLHDLGVIAFAVRPAWLETAVFDGCSPTKTAQAAFAAAVVEACLHEAVELFQDPAGPSNVGSSRNRPGYSCGDQVSGLGDVEVYPVPR